MKHTLSVLVEDESGVLSRISGLFARRGFNIESLAVGPAERSGVSRLTMVVEGDERTLAQMSRQLDKLINVLEVTDLTRILTAARIPELPHPYFGKVRDCYDLPDGTRIPGAVDGKTIAKALDTP